MSDENNVYFLNHGNQKLMFSAGRRKLELFNTTEILSKVIKGEAKLKCKIFIFYFIGCLLDKVKKFQRRIFSYIYEPFL